MNKLVRRDPWGTSLFAWPRWMEDFDETSSKGLRIHETDKEIIAEAVVAGVPASDVEITIEDGVITVKAEKSSDIKSEDGHQSTTSYQYYYTAALSPSAGQWDKAEAQTEDGVIKLTIPKAESAKRQKITVKSKDIKK